MSYENHQRVAVRRPEVVVGSWDLLLHRVQGNRLSSPLRNFGLMKWQLEFNRDAAQPRGIEGSVSRPAARSPFDNPFRVVMVWKAARAVILFGQRCRLLFFRHLQPLRMLLIELSLRLLILSRGSRI